MVALLEAADPSRLRHVVVTLREAGSLSAKLPDHVACRPLAVRGRCRTAGLGLASVTRFWRAAVIHARNTGCWSDATVARLLTPGARLVLGFHGLETAGALSAGQRRAAQRGLRVGARFASVSAAGGRQLREEAGIPSRRIDLLDNGVKLEPFLTLDKGVGGRTRACLGLPDTAFVVGIVGSLTPVKQHAMLIEAIARVSQTIRDVRLLIVGDGPLRAVLNRQVREAGLCDRVCFLGFREDIPAVMTAMNVYVCSSASEGMNNALLEAMAAGLPCVATNVGDNPRVLRDGVEGCVVGPRCSSAVADALIMLATAPDVRRRLATAAKGRAADFDFQKTVAAYEEYYKKLVAPRDGSGVAVRRRRPYVFDPHSSARL